MKKSKPKESKLVIKSRTSGQMYKEFKFFMDAIEKGKKSIFVSKDYVVISSSEYLKIQEQLKSNDAVVDFYKGLKPSKMKRMFSFIFGIFSPKGSGIKGPPLPRPEPKPRPNIPELDSIPPMPNLIHKESITDITLSKIIHDSDRIKVKIDDDVLNDVKDK